MKDEDLEREIDAAFTLHGDPSAEPPRGVLDMRHLAESKTLKRAGFGAPFAFRPAPIWTGTKR